jgi:hypothetical protein
MGDQVAVQRKSRTILRAPVSSTPRRLGMTGKKLRPVVANHPEDLPSLLLQDGIRMVHAVLFQDVEHMDYVLRFLKRLQTVLVMMNSFRRD